MVYIQKREQKQQAKFMIFFWAQNYKVCLQLMPKQVEKQLAVSSALKVKEKVFSIFKLSFKSSGWELLGKK